MMYFNDNCVSDSSHSFIFPTWLKDEHYEQCDHFEQDYVTAYSHPFVNFTNFFNFVFHKAYK